MSCPQKQPELTRKCFYHENVFTDRFFILHIAGIKSTKFKKNGN